MPRPRSIPIQSTTRRQDRLADRERGPKGTAGRSARRRPTSSPTSSPATRTPKSTRSGASGRSTTAARAGPAAYKTGTTNDNVDLAAYGFVAPPKDKDAPALAVGVWMGNSDNTPNDGKLSLDTSAPLWSAILTGRQQGHADRQVPPPDGPQDRHGRRVHRASSRVRSRARRSRRCSSPAPSRSQGDEPRSAREIDAASGLLWQDGCVGPKVTKGFLDLSEVDSAFPNWQKAEPQLGRPGRRGTGVGGRPKGTRTSYFYNGAFAPFGRTWGARSRRPSSARSARRARASAPIRSIRIGRSRLPAEPTEPGRSAWQRRRQRWRRRRRPPTPERPTARADGGGP